MDPAIGLLTENKEILDISCFADRFVWLRATPSHQPTRFAFGWARRRLRGRDTPAVFLPAYGMASGALRSRCQHHQPVGTARPVPNVAFRRSHAPGNSVTLPQPKLNRPAQTRALGRPRDHSHGIGISDLAPIHVEYRGGVLIIAFVRGISLRYRASHLPRTKSRSETEIAAGPTTKTNPTTPRRLRGGQLRSCSFSWHAGLLPTGCQKSIYDNANRAQHHRSAFIVRS